MNDRGDGMLPEYLLDVVFVADVTCHGAVSKAGGGDVGERAIQGHHGFALGVQGCAHSPSDEAFTAGDEDHAGLHSNEVPGTWAGAWHLNRDRYAPNSAGRRPVAQARIASQSRKSPSSDFIAFINSLIIRGSLL